MSMFRLLASLMLALAAVSVFSQNEPNRFQSFQSILGPVSMSAGQNLKVCATDVSVITKLGVRDEEDVLSKRVLNQPIFWSSTEVAIYDSTDATRQLPVEIPDLIFTSGRGQCINIAGREVGTDSKPRSIVVVLTTLTETGANFDPLVSGQFTAEDNTQAISLITPAVLRAADGETGGAYCCPCAPVCGCGACSE